MVYGDSVGVHYYRLATNRPLCKELFRTCSKKYMWTYDVSCKIWMSFLPFFRIGGKEVLEPEKENIIILYYSKNEWNYRNFKRLDNWIFRTVKLLKNQVSVLRNYDANHTTYIWWWSNLKWQYHPHSEKRLSSCTTSMVYKMLILIFIII